MNGSINRGLMSIGVFLVILVVCLVLGTSSLIDWWFIPSLVVALYGCWILTLGVLQLSNPQRYEHSAFNLFAWGLLLIALGGAWFLYVFNPMYSLALILLTLGALAIVSALRG